MADDLVLPCELQLVNASDPLFRFTLHNPLADEPLCILPWYSVLEKGMEQLRVTDVKSGEQLRYRGRMAKRAPPTTAHWIEVAPGGAVVHEFGLTVGGHILLYAIEQGKEYSVLPEESLRVHRGPLSGVKDDNDGEPCVTGTIQCEPVVFTYGEEEASK
eukprot:TRINITY_DN1875_c0_g1_i1.p1 TRINITY_DN1875_c0_g1~~TRINITY_DN1875_c0_g1_i1.p1  ORF type:complete len:159 (-),score=43.39 TRINITY_DN1875_c0_g1_i1:233-709(-)